LHESITLYGVIIEANSKNWKKKKKKKMKMEGSEAEGKQRKGMKNYLKTKYHSAHKAIEGLLRCLGFGACSSVVAERQIITTAVSTPSQHGPPLPPKKLYIFVLDLLLHLL